jgi:hypothetical protein
MEFRKSSISASSVGKSSALFPVRSRESTQSQGKLEERWERGNIRGDSRTEEHVLASICSRYLLHRSALFPKPPTRRIRDMDWRQGLQWGYKKIAVAHARDLKSGGRGEARGERQAPAPLVASGSGPGLAS